MLFSYLCIFVCILCIIFFNAPPFGILIINDADSNYIFFIGILSRYICCHYDVSFVCDFVSNEHEDFADEMKRLRALRGKVKPKKGEGKRAQNK